MERYVIELAGETHEVELSGDGAELVATVDGRSYALEALPVGRDAVHLTHGTRSRFAHVARENGNIHVQIRDANLIPAVHSEREWHFRSLGGAGGAAAGAGALDAPMPGKILEVRVAEGDAVEAGQPLVVLEAMKMENELRAAIDGVIERVSVKAGDAVEKGATLVVIGPGEEAA